MRLGKHLRHEKRVPSFSLLVSAVIFIAVFLVAIWMFSAPSPSDVRPDFDTNVASSSVDSNGKSSSYSQAFEDSTGAIGQTQVKVESEKKSEPEQNSEETNGKTDEDTVQEQSDSEHVDKVLDDESGNDVGPIENTVTKKSEEPTTEVKADANTDESKLLDEPATSGQLELAVESKEEPSSLVTQAKESKEEIIQATIQDEGLIVEKVDEKENSSSEQKENVNESIDSPSVDQLVSKQQDERSGVEQQGKWKDTVASNGKPDMPVIREEGPSESSTSQYSWKLCTWNGAADYIPCLDNVKAIGALPSRKHFEHRERHCPSGKELPTCLVPLPDGYKASIKWPESRDKIWYNNVPHNKLVSYKKDQNWVKQSGDLLLFPGGGTQFKNGATHYIESVGKLISDISWGKHVRLLLDVGCGVASFGGELFDKDVLTMSIAPKDEHEAQIQMALERGIPGFLAVMGTKRLVYPSNVFDVVHCARCRVPWHLEGGKLLLELNRLLRPGGFFVWSATPVYRSDPDEVKLWKDTKRVTDGMCWKLLARDRSADTVDGVGIAVFQKPTDNSCYDSRKKNLPPMCPTDDKPDAVWYVDMNSCLHRIPTGDGNRATKWPADWPQRLEETPEWLSSVPKGLFGKPAAEEFVADTEHWKHVIEKSYLRGIGIDWSGIRNVMEMKARFGGFGAALASQPVWVMNIVPTNEPDTLPIIFDRGLFGMYHDWCESFSTYPRTYDLLHSDHLFSGLKKRCGIFNTLIEMDRILRPGGWVIFRDKVNLLSEIEDIVKSLQWKVHFTVIQGEEQLLVLQKGFWRPKSVA